MAIDYRPARSLDDDQRGRQIDQAMGATPRIDEGVEHPVGHEGRFERRTS